MNNRSLTKPDSASDDNRNNAYVFERNPKTAVQAVLGALEELGIVDKQDGCYGLLG